MTNEEAISVIENEIQIDVRLCTDEQVQSFQEALYIAISALRNKPAGEPLTLEPARIDREALEPCEYCEGHEYPEEVSMLTADEYESDRGMYIYNGILVSNSGEFQMRKIDFCPVCGRPLTPEAWAELEKRLRG